MKRHQVRSIGLEVPVHTAFSLIADENRLPEWTSAFAAVENGKAILRTPRGEVEIGLRVEASRERGTVDWEMRFPDGASERAFSRLVPVGENGSVFSFVLLEPGSALEDLEGVLDAQSKTLAEELQRLKRLLEDG